MTENGLPIRCFIVDDDEDDREILATAMSKSILSNPILLFATDGEEAIGHLNTDSLPDYIFLDLNMPRMNGIQCLCEIRKSERLRQIPIVIYTTSTNDIARAEAMSLGATAFMSKPIRLNDLVSNLNEFFIANRAPQAI